MCVRLCAAKTASIIHGNGNSELYVHPVVHGHDTSKQILTQQFLF